MTHADSKVLFSRQSETPQEEASFNLCPHRPSFVPFGRKKGKLSDQALVRLETLLPHLNLPQAADRVTLLRQLGADPDTARLFLEIGFGNGQFLATLAARYVQDCFVGVEVFLEGVSGLVGRLQQMGLTNVWIVVKNVHEVLLGAIPPESLDRVIINFPDPWPKRSHHKRRLVQPDFLDLLATRMRPGSLLNLATDWSHYASWMLKVLEAHAAFRNRGTPGHFASEPTDWVETRFQCKAQEAGRPTFHLAYLRRTLSC